jgi:catechol 2,3-dioxygenase-like lactoylglutathione lyase family enzyme
MEIQFIASIAVITPDPPKSRELFIEALGLPLEASPGSDYFHSERVEGSKHFGVWPLSEAAQACFGTPDWPADRTVPQMSLEFEVCDADAVQSAAPGQPPGTRRERRCGLSGRSRTCNPQANARCHARRSPASRIAAPQGPSRARSASPTWRPARCPPGR